MGEIADVVMGQSPVGTSYNRDGDGSPLINGPTEFTARHPVPKQWTTAPVRFCEPGDVLICVRGSSTGRTNIADTAYCVGRGVAAVRASGGNDQTFVQYALAAVVADLLKLQTGSTFPSIDSRVIRGGSVLIPEPAEQRRIGAALLDADDTITALERMIAKKQVIKHGMMQQLLTGKSRLPGFTAEWHPRRLGEMLSYEQPGRYLVQTTKQLDTGRVPVLTAGRTFVLGYTNETHGVYTDRPVIIFDDFTTDSKFVTFDFKAKSSAMKILSAQSDVDLRFIYERMQLINFPLGDHKRYWISEYSKQELDVPDLAEQRAISSVITNCDDEIDLLKRRLAKARGTKTGMMQELLSGRTRLPVDEGAA